MVTIRKISTLEDLLKVWPRLCLLTRCDKADNVLRASLACLVNGAVFLVRNDYGLAGTCCVSRQGEAAVIHTMPVGGGESLGRRCLAEVADWARGEGLQRLQITNDRWNGSSFRYFEKSLGFERRMVTFVKEL